MDRTAQLLKDLTEAHGVPGYESEIRALLREHLEELGAVSQDKLGSIICHQDGQGPKVMLSSHMDEIGFMVQHITEKGFVKFLQLGGWWDQILLGHRVVIKTRKGDVVGVIGAKPPHLLQSEDREKVMKKNQMFIDVGANSREEVAEIGVQVGDPIVPQAGFAIMANQHAYLSKAFDNRIGCALTIDVLRASAGNGAPRPNNLYGVSTVMEEVGVRGARTSAHAIDPDVAIILEIDVAGDIPGIKEEESSVKLGGGPTILVYDSGMIPNLALRNLVIDIAAELEIAVQFSTMQGGATDGAAIHLHGTGVPTIAIGVPTRHIHSHGAIVYREDYDEAVRLVAALVSRLNEETVSALTN